MHGAAGWSKRFHAWLLAKGSAKYQRVVADRKRRLFADVRGDVLEIGPGTGVNLAYYQRDIRWIGIEPNPFMHAYFKEEAQRLGLNVDLRLGAAERLEAEDHSVDVVVSTLVLCSVPDLAGALQEILRVLKPGGRFLFMEHVAAPRGTRLRRIQRCIQPVWKVLGDGCHPDRETWAAIENAGFESVKIEHFPVPFPIIGPHIMGEAIRKGLPS
ncbi:MAG: class I SAM-dependent methyltransferase [Acidobacteria bacterium]|nr:class I SAM-dependent methyltransferase [Acidobacteriota bacterium]